MRRTSYTPAEYLQKARAAIRNAQISKEHGNALAVRASLNVARFYMRRARTTAQTDVQRQKVTRIAITID